MKATGLFSMAVAAFLPFAAGADLREDFARPQGTTRENTGPLFWMHGTETPERLREYVGRVDESGQGILTIGSRPHINWMRPEWWRDVDVVLDACKKRGVKMMVFDDYWWPSQGMGGKYPIPEKYQCRDIKAGVYAKGEAPGKVENEICRVVATETAKGVFRLGADGDKTIVYSWFVPPKGRVQGLGGSQGRFPYVNGLDEEAVDWFLASYYQPYYDRYRSSFEDGTIPGFFFDEPETMGLWGPALEKELAARGEDVGELLTAFKFKLANPEAQARAIYRYHDARAETWGRTMYGRQSAWCESHGVFSSGHFMEHQGCFYSQAMSGGNVMQLMKYVTVPGVDLVVRQYYPHQRNDRGRQIAFGQMPKIGSSVAHVYNRRNGKNWCEIFGAYGQDLTYPQMKWLCDWHQYQGCYFLIPHSFNPKSPYDTDCPPYFYNGGYEPRYPLFRVWADYNNRCALLLSEGEHVCHIAQCVPGMSFHAGKTIRPEMFAFAIQDAQLDSDWMCYDAVESAAIVKPRTEQNPSLQRERPRLSRPCLRTANGKEFYDILTLPATEYIPYAVLEKALAFAKAGGVVVGYGIKPSNTPTRGKTSDDVKRIVNAIFAQPTALFIDGEPDGAQLRAALAKKYPGTDQPLAVRAFDFEGLPAADGHMLAVNHYVKDGAETLFIANQDAARRRDLAVRTVWSTEKAELWDPMQGTVERPKVEGGLVKLALEPSQAVFLVWPSRECSRVEHVERVDIASGVGRGVLDAPRREGERPRAPLPRVDMPEGKVIAISATETVTPVKIPGVESPSLEGAKWIWHPVDPKAQGKVTFRAKIDAATAAQAKIVFACDNAAVVRVNGKEIAKQEAGADTYGWRTPTRATFNLKAGVNEIEVLGDNVIPGDAGFVASITWPTGALLTDGKSWTVNREGERPREPCEIGGYGRPPWGWLVSGPRVTRSPFAESVATTCAFTLPPLNPGERVFFVCDGTEGESSAAVTVNGAYAGGFIGAPYRLDITRSVKMGANTLEAKPFRLKNPRIVIVSSATPGLDDPAKPWSYFVHPVTCIGMPLQTAKIGIQVTPEGTIFTGEHELALFFGDERKPLACRQRRFVGDMPIVEDEWRDGDCQYRWTLFGATLPCDPRNENTAVFARLEVCNVGAGTATPKIWASMKASGGFRREGRAPFNACWRYRFNGDELWRGSRGRSPSRCGDEGRECLQVIYPAGADTKFAALGEPYKEPFTAEDVGIGANTDAGIVLYRPNLKPGESRCFAFKLPRAPTADAKYLAVLRDADFDKELKAVQDYWRKMLFSKSEILTPGEPRVASIHRQTAAHVLLASRCYGGKPQQTDALPYPMCFLSAQYEYQLLYHDFGWLKMFAAYLDRFTERQQPDGLFVDTSLSHGQKIFCVHGQPLSCICNTVVELEDRTLGEKYFPAIVRAVDCIRNDSDTQPHGLMRASIPYDNEMIKGQYTSHNYWSIIGLRAAIRLADFLGRDVEAKAWREFLAKYQALVLKAVRESADPDGYVPTGLYGFITGRAARHGFDEFRTDQDWENEMLLWPTELVQPGDPLVSGTLKRLHATKYREGIMSYRNGQHLHQYITCRAANQSIAEGDARNALIDFYHCIIHSGPAGESFENMIEPWNKRDVEFCPPPHAWGNANCNTLVRNLFLFERGDDTLYVLPALSRAWLKDGEPCGILRAPTRFGEVSVTIVPDAHGATLTLDAQWKREPKHIYFRIPYFVKDWKGERVVELSPEEKSRRFEWRIDETADRGLYAEILRRYRREPGHWKGKRSEMPPIPEAKLTPEEERTEITLSFPGVLQAWRHEYALRRGARGEPEFKPVQMRAPGGRASPRAANSGGRASSRAVPGDLLYRAKTTCSKGAERPAAAVDGFMGVKDHGYFECGVNGWWQADMGKVQDVSEITVIPYYRDAKRPYRFMVKTSVDGVNWTLHIDKRGNNQPFGAAGLSEKFQNTPMRYIRVENAGGNTVNKHLHLVEVLAK